MKPEDYAAQSKDCRAAMRLSSMHWRKAHPLQFAKRSRWLGEAVIWREAARIYNELAIKYPLPSPFDVQSSMLNVRSSPPPQQ